MRRRTFVASAAGFLGANAFAHGATLNTSTPDLIVTNATIHTVDPRFVNPEAFVVRNGRFAFVGSLRGAKNYAKRGAKTLDLAHATVLPGLIDSHMHLLRVGLALHEVDLFHLTSYDDVVRKTLEYARTSPDTWIIGDGWDQNLWPSKAFPTHDALSQALPNRPVSLNRVDGHALLANAKAMELADVTKNTPDPAGGRIIRDSSGNPTGVFVDNARALITQAIPPPTDDQIRRATIAAIGECNRWGITAIGDPGVSRQTAQAYDRVADENKFTLRNHVMIADNAEMIAAHFAHGPIVGAYDGRLQIRSVKLYIDGALGSRGAALLEPYSDDPGNTGLLRTTQAHIQDVATRALRASFQTSVHAIGDRGNRIVLDAYQAALAAVPTRDHRFRIEHAQVLSPQDIPRFAQLGVIPAMQSTHQISDMYWAATRLGPQRVLGAYAWRSLLDTGVIIPNGTDAPVEAVNPLRTFHAAISRQNEENQPPGGWYPNQAMTREEALKSMTIWAARANFMEREIGSISPGKYADFVVMDRDWLRAPVDAIMATGLIAAHFGGKLIYRSGTALRAESLRGRSSRNGCFCSPDEARLTRPV
jgi:predicted amidohydrolase YtcJ